MIRLEHIEKRFGEHRVLCDVNLRVAAGEFAILLGPSGGGKTLLLSLIAGLETPTSGRVFLGGRDMTRVPPERRPVTMVFQRHALFPNLTVFENVAFSLRARGIGGGTVKRRVNELLELSGLTEYARIKPGLLSGGQCQRVAFVRALASDAEVLLFDEPLNSLDSEMKTALVHELKSLHRRARFTALYVTHNVSEASALGESIYQLRPATLLPPQSVCDPCAPRASFGVMGPIRPSPAVFRGETVDAG